MPEADETVERAAAEALLLGMDGDFLPGAGLSIGNTGEDVALSDARPKEVAHWAAQTLAAAGLLTTVRADTAGQPEPWGGDPV